MIQITEIHSSTGEETFIRSLAGQKIPEIELREITSGSVRREKAAAALLDMFPIERDKRLVQAFFRFGEFRGKSEEECATILGYGYFSRIRDKTFAMVNPLIGKPATLAAIRGQE